MDRLSADDLAAILKLAYALGDAGHPDEFLDLCLEGIIQLVPAMVATMNEVVPQADRIEVRVRPESFPIPDHVNAALAQLAEVHPLISHIASSGDGSARRISDFWTQAQFHSSELYERVYRPMGIEYQVAVAFPVPRPTVLGLAMNRDDRDFSERDIAALNAVRPHLVQRWRTLRDHARLQGLLDAATAVVDETETGVLVLWDPPEELTPGTLVSMYRYFGRPGRVSPFPLRVTRWLEAERARMAEMPLAMSRPLSAQLDGHRVVLRYLPPKGQHPGAILVTESGPRSDGPGLFALGLSDREVDVVSLVVKGLTNREIALQLNVAPGTVKKHLDNVYEKLGVHGRGALTAFVFSSMGTQ